MTKRPFFRTHALVMLYLLDAVEAFAFRDVEAIPVVDAVDRRKLLGMIYRRDINQEYKRRNLIHAFGQHR